MTDNRMPDARRGKHGPCNAARDASVTPAAERGRHAKGSRPTRRTGADDPATSQPMGVRRPRGRLELTDKQRSLSITGRQPRVGAPGTPAAGRHGGDSRRPACRGGSRRWLALVASIAVVVLVAVVAVAVWHGTRGSRVTPGQPVEIQIAEGSSSSQVASGLADAHVVSSSRSFRQAIAQAGIDTSIQPGRYTGFTTGMSDEEALAVLQAGPVRQANLVVPEGYDLKDIANALQTSCGISAEDFLAATRDASVWAADYPFLAEAGTSSLEGYLFPKSYQVPDGAAAADVVRLMLDQFQSETSPIDFSYAQGRGLTERDVVIIASMIEKEVPVESQRADAASVVYNRLAAGMRLQMDSTVIYALGDSYTGDGLVTYDQLEVDSPYNTYRVDGLPAGPICSPGLASLEAAAHPSTTDYLYFVNADTDGNMAFSSNYDDFSANVAHYEGLLAQSEQ